MTAAVIPFPRARLRLPRPTPVAVAVRSLELLALRRQAWQRANPNATADEELAAAAVIAKELGL